MSDYGLLIVGAIPGAFLGYWVAIIRVRLARGTRAAKRPL